MINLSLRQLEAAGLSAYTLRNYRSDISAYLQDKDPLALDRHDLRSYLTSLNGTAPASLRRKLSTIRGFYRWLAAEKYIDSDPLRGVNGLPKVPHRLPGVLSHDEMVALLAAPDTNTPEGARDRALLEVLYATGVRLGEVHGLDLDDVNMTERTLRVTGKGNKEREVLFGQPASEALRDYLIARKLMARQGEQAVFVSRDGGRMARASIGNMVRKYGKRIGKRVHVHTLRHSFATSMLDGGADIRIVQELLGHASPATTALYLHVTDAQQRKVYERAWERRNGLGESEAQRRLRYFLEDTR